MGRDYLILGSGLAGLSVGALLARAGAPVRVLEAHYHAGGYGHTFVEGPYRFNAQLHYVWNCGEGRTVDNFLRKLGLADEVTFEEYDRSGFDRMRMPGYALDIPSDLGLLGDRLADLCPGHGPAIRGFLDEVALVAEGLDNLAALRRPLAAVRHLAAFRRVVRRRRATLQDVFDACRLPRPAQTLLALQWPDFMLPPDRLSFFAWVQLFVGYCRGAYYPTRHFEHVVDSLVDLIRQRGGEVLLRHRVRQFLLEGRRVVGVVAEEVGDNGDATGRVHEFRAGEVICNMDPRRAAEMIGLDRFSRRVRRKLDYEYSASSFMAYCVYEGDLRDHGFGRSNLFHTEHEDLNEVFRAMYQRGDYSRPSFAVTVPGLLTSVGGDCPEGKQIIEFLTVANYQRFLQLKLADERAYRARKRQILDAILDVMQRHYVPDLRDRLCFKMTGSPTTNERYCSSPAGHSYGSDMTPANIGLGRLDHRSSLERFHFCSASAGFAGFTGTIWTGCRLYEHLTGDRVHEGPHLRRPG